MIILITHVTPTATALCFGIHLANLHSQNIDFLPSICVFETILMVGRERKPLICQEPLPLMGRMKDLPLFILNFNYKI
jgi:hypothetical protein